MDKLITGTDVNYKELEKGEIKLPVSRTLYLNTILGKLKSTAITKNETYKTIVNSLNKEQLEEIRLPKINANLRYYQKTGFKWLKTLDEYKFGGILADDMGLGKTVQVLSIILDYIQNNKEKQTSLVIAPSSLTLNWKNETEKFAPTLKTPQYHHIALMKMNQLSNKKILIKNQTRSL